jgi:uncharacterized OB-fold protein
VSALASVESAVGVLITETWSDEARRGAYLARIRRLRPGGTSTLLDHGVRVERKHDGKIHVSSPHSLTEHQPDEHAAVDAVFRHQEKATRRRKMVWAQPVLQAEIEGAVAQVLEARDSSASDSHRNVKCPKCNTVQSATHKTCSNCGHDLADARKAKFAKAEEAAYRSVKARNLRKGHRIHNAGGVSDVTRIPGALNGERVRATLDSGDTMTYAPEERVSVTSDPVTEAVELAVEESLRDAAASRLRWIKWEKSHGAYSLKGSASRGIEPRHLQELPRGQKLRLPSGNEIHRNDSGSFDVHMHTDGLTAKGKTAAQAAKQAQAVESDFKAGQPEVIEKSEKAGMTKIKLGGAEHIVGQHGRLLHTPKDPSAPGIVHHERTGNYHVASMLPKDAMVRGSKVHFPGEPKYKSETQVKAQNDPVRKAWKEGKTPGGAALPAGVHHVDDLPTGAKAKPVDDHGKTSEHNPVYTKQPDGSMRAPSGAQVADPSGSLWKHQGGPKPKKKVREADMSAIEDAVADVLEAKTKGKPLSDAVKRPGQLHRDLGVPEGEKIPMAKIRDAAKNHKDEKVRKRARLALTFKKINEAEEVSAEELDEVLEAKDSMRKASTPEPFSSSKTSNWVARVGGLPAYIQHIAHDLMEKRGKTESNAIQMAIGIVKRWAKGLGNVDSNTRAAAAKAWSEWLAKRAAAHGLSKVTAAAEEFMWDENDPAVIAEAERLEREPELIAQILEAAERITAEAASSPDVNTDGDRSDGIKVKCPECNHRTVPKSGKCANCGHDVSKLAAMAKRMHGKSKTTEAEERNPVHDAIRHALA